MSPSRRLTWTLVRRLSVAVTAVTAVVVLTGGLALWAIEGNRPGSTVRSAADGVWWAITTLTTVGYGDHVPVTAAGRVVAAAVMVAGVAVIGAVAAVVALAVAARMAAAEERALEAEAVTLEQRLEERLDRLEAKLDRLLAERAADPPRGD
ncbi:MULTISPECIES: potassium channel family protein [unclassified Blastococcus]